MRSRRPYLIRAIHQWAVDEGQTPHLLVAADYEGCVVPQSHAQDGRITLNISDRAVSGLQMDDDRIRFSARFGGRPFQCDIPCGAVLAIFGRESGEGIVFGEVEPPQPPPAPDGSRDEEPARPGRSHLRVVK